MKIPLFVVVVLFTVAVRTQEPLDEFGRLTCEDLQARTYGLGDALEKNPQSTALVLLYPRHGELARTERDRTSIYRILRRGGFDTSRVKFFRGPEGDEPRGIIWVAPPGFDMTKVTTLGDPWPYEPPNRDLSKPFLFDRESELGVCEMFVPADYADLIKNNPGVIGKIIVHADGKFSRGAIGRQWISTFVDKYQIPRSRLRLIFGKPTKFEEYAEFWIAPLKQGQTK